MEQAARVSDRCAFLLMAADKCGELIEYDATAKLFNSPTDSRTLDYVNGRFG
jgi:phosphate transport system ATP-binding protein